MSPAKKETARKILDFLEATYVAHHDFAEVESREFRHLDLKFYERTRALLEGHGFTHIADLEDRTISSVPGGILHRVLIRVMLSPDRTVSASLFHPKLKKLWVRILLFLFRKSLGRTIDLETEFTDGSFLCTSNAATAAAIELPPLIHSEYWPWKTPAETLLARHRERITEALSTRPGVFVRPMRDLAEVHAAQHRMNALKAAYRGEIGGISPEELAALAPDADPGDLAELHAEIQEQAARR